MTQKIIWGLKMNNFLMFLIKICQYENLNSMLSEARQFFFKNFLCYLCIRRCNLDLRI